MTNNTDTQVPSFYTDDALALVLAHSEVRFPGDIRRAEALLKVAPEHRMTVESEAHLAANMVGGRVSDHRDQLVAAYLRAERPNDYIDYLRDGQRRIAQNKRF